MMTEISYGKLPVYTAHIIRKGAWVRLEGHSKEFNELYTRIRESGFKCERCNRRDIIRVRRSFFNILVTYYAYAGGEEYAGMTLRDFAIKLRDTQ